MNLDVEISKICSVDREAEKQVVYAIANMTQPATSERFHHEVGAGLGCHPNKHFERRLWRSKCDRVHGRNACLF